MRYATPRFRRVATQLLAQEVGEEATTSDALAAASGRLLDRLTYRVADVVGPAGVHAIFLRAVKLRKLEFAFLDECIIPREQDGGLAESLRDCLREQDPEVIQKVAVILFATFAGLLATVVGERLSWSLLQQIWPDTVLSDTDLQETEE